MFCKASLIFGLLSEEGRDFSLVVCAFGKVDGNGDELSASISPSPLLFSSSDVICNTRLAEASPFSPSAEPFASSPLRALWERAAVPLNRLWEVGW